MDKERELRGSRDAEHSHTSPTATFSIFLTSPESVRISSRYPLPASRSSNNTSQYPDSSGFASARADIRLPSSAKEKK